MPTIREIQEAVSRIHDTGATDPEATLRKLYEELGDIPVQDLKKAFAALAEEHDIQANEAEQEVLVLKRVMAIVGRAALESGKPEITTLDAAKFLAERGDEEGKALLAMLNNPRRKALDAELEAAVEWHPHWHTKGKYFRHDKGCEANTPEKLLAAYRNHKSLPANEA